MGTQVPAGWYVDPSDKSLYRYWSGEHWTTHTHDKALVDIAAAESEMRPLPDFDALDDEGNPVPAKEKRRRVPVLLAVVALVAVVATAGVVAFKPGPSGHSLTGEIRVPAPAAAGGVHSFAGDGAPCGGSGGRGVGTGDPVTVTSARGDELGTTELGEGRIDRTLASTACVFTYTVDGVDDASVYVVRVGRHRVARASRASVEAADWQLDGRMG
jgi:hypothetical protein